MQPRQQEQQRHLIYASRSSREAVANACMKSTALSEDKPSVRQRIRTETDRTVTSSLPCWAASAQVDRARGARGPLTLRLAVTPERELRGSNKQREDVLFYVCNRLKENSGWVPEREHMPKMGSGSFSMFDSRCASSWWRKKIRATNAITSRL